MERYELWMQLPIFAKLAITGSIFGIDDDGGIELTRGIKKINKTAADLGN